MISLTFERGRDDEGNIWFTAYVRGETAGSVLVREHREDEIAIAKLYVAPDRRGLHIARGLMQTVLHAYPGADAWLYAEPFALPGEPDGLPQQDLERFYASLGFASVIDPDCRRLMARRARTISLTAAAESR